MSLAAISACRSARFKVRASIWMFAAPAHAARSRAKSSGKWSGSVTLSTRIRSLRSPNAARCAATAASGFLRTKLLARLMTASVTTARSGRPNAARLSRLGAGGRKASG